MSSKLFIKLNSEYNLMLHGSQFTVYNLNGSWYINKAHGVGHMAQGYSTDIFFTLRPMPCALRLLFIPLTVYGLPLTI